MLASTHQCSSPAGCLSGLLAEMEMSSDKAGELKRRWATENKAQLRPPEWLHSTGCEFSGPGTRLSSCPRASRKVIKDAIRSVFKDESECPLFLSSVPPNSLPFHRPALKMSDLLVQTTARHADAGHTWNLPSFSPPCQAVMLKDGVQLCVKFSYHGDIKKAYLHVMLSGVLSFSSHAPQVCL